MKAAERHGRPSNVILRSRAGARIKLWPAADPLRSKLPPATRIQMDRGSSARSYKISSNVKRIDDILTVTHQDRQRTAVIVELKQWQKAAATRKDAIASTFFTEFEARTTAIKHLEPILSVSA